MTRVERAIAGAVVDHVGVRHLLTCPGLGLTSAASLVAVIGEVARFPRPAKLVSYLGLDPRVRQSGTRSFTGHISRAGQGHVRGLLIEAAHAAIRTPGPLRGFHARVEHRRGAGVAIVAVARKLAVIAWHLLSKDEDYAWSPTLRSAEKVRAMERLAGDPRRLGRAGTTMGGPGAARERAGLEVAQAAYERFVAARARQREATAAKGERLDGPVEPGPAAPRS